MLKSVEMKQNLLELKNSAIAVLENKELEKTNEKLEKENTINNEIELAKAKLKLRGNL